MSITQSISKNAFGKKTLVLSAFAFAALTSVAAIKYATDFSGDWKLNEQKSELGEFGGRMAAKKMKLAGATESLSIDRSMTSPEGGETTASEKLSLDGKETESTVFGNSKKKSVAKWSADGKTLNVNSNISFERDGQSMEIKVTETWKLSEDGKQLMIEQTSTSSWGTNTMKLVYDKA